MNSVPALIDDLPDIVFDLRRDGIILGHMGGRAVPHLRVPHDADGKSLDVCYPLAVAYLLRQLTRRSIAARGTCEARFVHEGTGYEARVTARSADRVICVIRALLPVPSTKELSASDAASGARVDRREFLGRLTESVSTALLTERSLALAIIHLEGITEISQLMDTSVADRVLGAALQRLDGVGRDLQDNGVWYLGQVADNELALIVESCARDRIEMRALEVCDNLRGPLEYGDAVFHLRPFVGVAILGQDATSQKSLFEHARAAAVEARRSESSAANFFSDTMKLRALTRIDVARELREAIAHGQIRLRYRGRHDLASGRLVALVGYLKWTHPVRGDVRPAHFLAVAAATGLSTALSRSCLERLREDFETFGAHLPDGVRISYGALRHHVLDEAFTSDITSLLNSAAISAEQLELRISERTYVARDAHEWRRFADLGVQLVVDEVGRKASSIDRLARAPLWGLQLDRSCAAAVDADVSSIRACRAVLGVAQALDLTPITTAVDDERQREVFEDLGWTQGIGDLYDAAGADAADALRQSP